jgi:hypothetical protein
MEVVITKSSKKSKKYDAVINGSKTISFGDSSYQDYTKHKDPQRKEAYIARHSKEDWSKSNIASPAWMSRYILWEKPTLKGAIDNANKKYKDVKFILK